MELWVSWLQNDLSPPSNGSASGVGLGLLLARVPHYLLPIGVSDAIIQVPDHILLWHWL